MKEISRRLVQDMQWRLSPAGRRFRPSRKDFENWGSATIPWAAPVFGSCAVQLLSFGLTIAAFDADLFPVGMLTIGLIFAALPLGFWVSGRAQQRQDLKAYTALLNRNERFSLVEYSRLLSRQIQAAQVDQALGGPAEVKRLQELHGKIIGLLNDGAAAAPATPSAVASESLLAESVIEAYTAGQGDGLAVLDSRLPAELRSRLDELDAEAADASSAPRERE